MSVVQLRRNIVLVLVDMQPNMDKKGGKQRWIAELPASTMPWLVGESNINNYQNYHIW
jgi:NTP pyrophosphatase (non-canonical NTP hydrolase)